MIPNQFFITCFTACREVLLGPIIFLLDINVLTNISKLKTTLFADDTNLHLSNTCLQQLQIEATIEINEVGEWMTKID